MWCFKFRIVKYFVKNYLGESFKFVCQDYLRKWRTIIAHELLHFYTKKYMGLSPRYFYATLVNLEDDIFSYFSDKHFQTNNRDLQSQRKRRRVTLTFMCAISVTEPVTGALLEANIRRWNMPRSCSPNTGRAIYCAGTDSCVATRTLLRVGQVVTQVVMKYLRYIATLLKCNGMSDCDWATSSGHTEWNRVSYTMEQKLLDPE